MSITGLNSTMFNLTSKYISLINEFIIKQKHGDVIEDEKKQEILSVIEGILLKDSSDLSSRFLAVTLENYLRRNKKEIRFKNFITDLCSDISEKRFNKDVLEKLDLIATALEEENLEASSKMNGE